MFKIIDKKGHIYNAYGAFFDEDGDIQFILYDEDAHQFYKTDYVPGFFDLYVEKA